MSNSLRKIAKRLEAEEAQRKQENRILDALLFRHSKAPSDECADERHRLRQRFRAFMDSMQTSDPEQALRFARECRKDYDAKRDGPSEWMQMLDDCDALRDTEKELRAQGLTEPGVIIH